MDNEVTLTPDQLVLAETIARDINCFGSALVPNELIRKVFKDREAAILWLAENCFWTMKVDKFLDLVLITADIPPDSASLDIPTVAKQVKRLIRKNEREGTK